MQPDLISINHSCCMIAQYKQTTVVLLHDPPTHYTYNDVVIVLVPIPITSQLQVLETLVYPCLS